MRVLALDTTTRAGSAAALVDDRIASERAGDGARSHAERLPAELWAVLDDAGLALRDVDLFAVAAGPGSFTGLRIGIATIQGLALVLQRRVVPISALEALACAASAALEPGSIVAAWMDAHRRDVFGALYRVEHAPAFGPGRLVELDEPSVGSPAATLDRWRRIGEPTTVIGDGAMAYAELLARRARVVPPPLLAGILGRMAIARADRAVHPAAIHPLYVRRPDAELARDGRMQPRR
jgi:tRNA threonylcarbamoyladenosine biosynthesis protein TsaB